MNLTIATDKISACARCLTLAALITLIVGCEAGKPDFEYVYLPGTEIGSVEIVRLATDPRFILEVEAVAVIPD